MRYELSIRTLFACALLSGGVTAQPGESADSAEEATETEAASGPTEETETVGQPQSDQPDQPDQPDQSGPKTNPSDSEPVGADPKPKPSDESPAEQPPGPEMEARAAFRNGDQLYLEGDYQGAVLAFERAYALSGRIEMLFNLANAHERLGNYERASVALRGYIPHSPAQNREALEKRLARFEQLAEEKRQKDEKTAEVVKELKENPQPFPVERTIGIGLITLGGAGLVTGAGFAVSAAGARSELDETCESGEEGRLCPSDAGQMLDRDAAHSTIADVAIVSGVILAAGGTYLLIHSRKKEKEKVDLQIGLGPGRVSLGGRF